MALRGLLFFSTICYLLQRGKIEGGYGKLWSKEELESEKEIELLNKQGLKTIKTQFGEVYDCVDFYKQPAFDHPLLKDTKYDHHQMGPNLLPTINNETIRINQTSEIGLPGEGCPAGTVPILRITKKTLIGERLLKAKYGSKNGDMNTPGTSYRAVARTYNDPSRKYNGGKTVMSIYKPSVVGYYQYSTSEMNLGNGLDSIGVGWIVFPHMYGDALPHFFIYTITNTTACFNICMGFVVVSTRLPLGATLWPISRSGKYIYAHRYFIYREQVSGRWWLVSGTDKTVVGYWPPQIFNGLKDLASYVEWGSEAYTIPGNNGPDMGTGRFPIWDPFYDAFCGEISIVNEQHEMVDAGYTEVINENVDYYKAIDVGMTKIAGHTILFGGPGPKN